MCKSIRCANVVGIEMSARRWHLTAINSALDVKRPSVGVIAPPISCLLV